MPINLHRFSLGNVPKFAWPGGYPIVAIMDDGEHVCADCLNDATNPLHFGGENDGWRIEGWEILEGSAEDYDGAVICAHCNSVIVED